MKGGGGEERRWEEVVVEWRRSVDKKGVRGEGTQRREGERSGRETCRPGTGDERGRVVEGSGGKGWW